MFPGAMPSSIPYWNGSSMPYVRPYGNVYGSGGMVLNFSGELVGSFHVLGLANLGLDSARLLIDIASIIIFSNCQANLPFMMFLRIGMMLLYVLLAAFAVF